MSAYDEDEADGFGLPGRVWEEIVFRIKIERLTGVSEGWNIE